MQEGLRELETLLDPYDWFYEAAAEAHRYVIYVNYMDKSQDSIIPDKMHGKQVVVHFTRSKTVTAQDYLVGNKPVAISWDGIPTLARLNDDDIDVPNLNELCRELDRLEKQCGSNILQDIFYEIHDKKNAVTNLGARYPEVQSAMKRLYDEYGFDTIYNELDG